MTYRELEKLINFKMKELVSDILHNPQFRFAEVNYMCREAARDVVKEVRKREGDERKEKTKC